MLKQVAQAHPTKLSAGGARTCISLPLLTLHSCQEHAVSALETVHPQPSRSAHPAQLHANGARHVQPVLDPVDQHMLYLVNVLISAQVGPAGQQKDL